MNTGKKPAKKRRERKITIVISEDLYQVLVEYDKYMNATYRTVREREALTRLGIPLLCPASMASVLLEEKLRELKF